MLCAQLLNMLAPDQVAAWLLASWPFAPNAMTVSVWGLRGLGSLIGVGKGQKAQQEAGNSV
jgi:hypothetical protein